MNIAHPLPDDEFQETVLLDALRLSLTEIRSLLVAIGQYHLDELTDPVQYGRMSKRELLLKAFREGDTWTLLSALHEKGALGEDSLQTIKESGIDLDPSGGEEAASRVSAGSTSGEGKVHDDETSGPGKPTGIEHFRRGVSSKLTPILKLLSATLNEWRKLPLHSRFAIGIPAIIGVLGLIIALVGIQATLVAPILGEFAADEIRRRSELPDTFAATLAPTDSTTQRVILPQTNTPPPSSEPTATPSSAALQTIPAQVPSPTEQSNPPVNISEVMLVPHAPNGDESIESWNEYVELYNYGDGQVDVRGWWISDVGAIGNPDMIVAWSDRMMGIPVGKAITNSTVIPPGGYALVLSINYADGDKPYSDLVRESTIILTLADDPETESELIGKDGLSATDERLDVIVLYKGTSARIEVVISTYGTPEIDQDGNTASIRDNGSDAIPRAISLDWGGFRRVFPSGIDTQSNWARFTWAGISPGY